MRASHFFQLRSNLGRSFDVSYQYHQQVLTICFFAAVIASSYWIIIQSIQVPVALLASTYLALGTGLSWAIGREIMPPQEKAAISLLPILAGIIWWFGLPSLALMGAVLLLMRVINQVCNQPMTIVDLVAILGLFSWVSLTTTLSFGNRPIEFIGLSMIFLVLFVVYAARASITSMNDTNNALLNRKKVILGTWIAGCIAISHTFLTDTSITFPLIVILTLLNGIYHTMHSKDPQ